MARPWKPEEVMDKEDLQSCEDGAVCLLQGGAFLEKAVLEDLAIKESPPAEAEDCPDICGKCKKGGGAIGAKLVNGMCIEYCNIFTLPGGRSTYTGCVKKEARLGTDCTKCIAPQPPPAGVAVTPAPTEASHDEEEAEDETTGGTNFRALPKKSCDPATKAKKWSAYGSRAAAEEACKAEGCERLGTKEEQIEYGSLCSVLWSSQDKGYFMVGKHAGCGRDGWNGGGWASTAGSFCAGCPDCPTTEEEEQEQEQEQEVDEGTTEEEAETEATGDCPAACSTCKKGWGSANVDLVNGVCLAKCSADHNTCVKTTTGSEGTDCTRCTAPPPAPAPAAPPKGRAPAEGGSSTTTTEEGSNFRALPKKSCDPATKAKKWSAYGSRAAAEEACKAEGCERLGTKEEQIEYGSLCSVLWSSQDKGYFMVGKHAGCGRDGWNGGGWASTAGAFCAGCPDCPTTEEEEQEQEQEVDEGTTEEEAETEATGDCPAACSTCKKGWGSANVDLVNGVCLAKCSADHNTCVKATTGSEGTDCTRCTAPPPAPAPAAPPKGRLPAEGGSSTTEETATESTGDCPAACSTCKKGWGSANVDLVNGVCLAKCSADHNTCVKTTTGFEGIDCTRCTAPPSTSTETSQGEDEAGGNEASKATPKRMYTITLSMPLSLQSMTAAVQEELSRGAEDVFDCGAGVTCSTQLRGGSGTSFIQSQANFMVVIVVVVSGSADELAALPDPTSDVASLQASILASLQAAASDPDLQTALESTNVESIAAESGTVWIQGQNAENGGISCLTVDGTYADHLYSDHFGGHGEIWYGPLSEAKERCDANDECVVLHDWDGDNRAWRACRSVTYNGGGPAHTMVRS